MPLEQAEDLTQSFVLDKILQRNLLKSANRERGRFRNFLLTAFRNHVLTLRRRDNSERRSPANGFVCLEDMEPIAASEEEESIFNEAFARQVIAEAIHRTHEYCMEHEKVDVWEILHARMLGPALEGAEPVPYDELVRELELASSTVAQTKLGTAKRIFRRQFHSIVEDYSRSGETVEAEIEFLKKFLDKTNQINALTP